MNAPHKIDVSKGQTIGTVSNQWFSRPDDQKFTSLTALRDKVAGWAAGSEELNIDPRGFTASGGKDGGLVIGHESLDPDELLALTNYGFTDIARLAGAPSTYLSKLPAKIAADCLNYGFTGCENKPVQAYIGSGAGNGFEAPTLRALTSTKYGRILDRDVVNEVMKLAGDGTGDTRWKVPGVIDWGSMRYNPNVDITKETTTLFASDRDIFLFLCDDLNPIEVGKLPSGDPDLLFRGFYVWNSETGSRTFGISTMYLRGVCQNRNLWGVEGFSETTFRHTAGAPAKFMAEAAPALLSYAEGATDKLIAGVTEAKGQIVAKTEEERIDFLVKFGFSRKAALDMIATHIVEEGTAPGSVWDFAQAMTAQARSCQYQDQRVKLEQQAGKLLDKIKA